MNTAPISRGGAVKEELGISLLRALRPLIAWLVVGLVMLLLALLDLEGPLARLAVTVVPLGNLVFIVGVLVVALWQDHRQLYLPFVPYLLAVAAYHCFGPLIFVFGSPDDRLFASKFFPVALPDLVRVLLLVQVCQLGVVTFYALWRALLGSWLRRMAGRNEASGDRLFPLFLVFAFWALAEKYLVQLPVDLRWVETKPPGLLIISGYLSYAAHFYFWFRVAKGTLRWRLPLLFVLVDVAFGVVLLAKTYMFLPILALILGWHLARPLRLKAWFGLGLAGVLGLGLLQPLNAYLRIRRSQGESASVVDLAKDLSTLLSLENLAELQEMKQTGDINTSAHSRLSYVDSMAYGIHEYIQGRPGDSYKHFRYLLIPRMLWPAKPLVEPGLDFTRRVAGHELSYTGITLFGEAYFNLGALGVALLWLWLPLLLLVAELPARLVIEGGQMEQIFPLFLCVRVGMSADGYAILVVSSFVIATVSMSLLIAFSKSIHRI